MFTGFVSTNRTLVPSPSGEKGEGRVYPFRGMVLLYPKNESAEFCADEMQKRNESNQHVVSTR